MRDRIIEVGMRELRKKMCFLRDISSMKKKDRDLYIKQCSEKNIHIICECIYNILEGECGGKVVNKSHLMKSLKKISNPGLKISKKRELLSNQYGTGIFSLILSTAIPFLIKLLSKR